MHSTISIVFWGHACFGIHRGSNTMLLIDPFDPQGLGNTPGPPAIETQYEHVIATHAHSDHAAFHTQPDATRIHAPFHDESLALRIDGHTVAHDEFGGRLRGGNTQVLDIRIGERRIVHMGDIGERLLPWKLDWLRSPRPDLLIVPAGGYFTLGADGASAFAAEVRPRFVAFCHTRDDGLALPQMAERAVIQRRVAHWPQHQSDRLQLSEERTETKDGGTSLEMPTVVWFTRPDGRGFEQSTTK